MSIFSSLPPEPGTPGTPVRRYPRKQPYEALGPGGALQALRGSWGGPYGPYEITYTPRHLWRRPVWAAVRRDGPDAGWTTAERGPDELLKAMTRQYVLERVARKHAELDAEARVP